MSSNSAIGALIGLALVVVGAAAVIKIVDDAFKEKKYICPECEQTLRKGQKKCTNCGTIIKWA